MNTNDILLHHFLVEVPNANPQALPNANTEQILGTITANLLYYGYVPSQDVLEAIKRLAQTSESELNAWWKSLEKSLKKIKGADKNIGKYIVYQNFPKEVLQMSEAEYWTKQILIYWGINPVYLQQAPAPRDPMFEKVDFKVLHLARPDALKNVFASLLSKPAAWIEQEKEEVTWFVTQGYTASIEILFKENLVFAAIAYMQANQLIQLSTTTDVLRLATGLSGGDISLDTNTRFKLKRSQRKYILSVLQGVSDLSEGVMRHKNKWIRLFHQLHVGEYVKKYPKIYQVAQALRAGDKLPTFNSKVEAYLAKKDPALLPLLAQRPGEFARRVVHVLTVFGEPALSYFLPVLSKMETIKLLKLKRFLRTYNERDYRIFTPKGSWLKAQVALSDAKLKEEDLQVIIRAIDQIVQQRVTEKFGNTFYYTADIAHIKLPTNNKDAVSRYPKGTVFQIPQNIQFIRTATYWEETRGICWMDNGWNFFDHNWQPYGTCCWNNTHEMGDAAVFSGDPVNSYNKEGKAGQLIDLYLDKLLQSGVRYAVWNILSYSHIQFDDIQDVRGLMMWGEQPEKGQLIEPSRVNFAFPVTGKALTKYVCYVDLVTRQLVLMDNNLWGNVQSAKVNEKVLAEKMPAVVEYLDAIPSLLDIFETFSVEPAPDALKVVYTDEQVAINNEKAFVFLPKNKQNQFEPISLEALATV
ncbi:hypothetical protein BKI52_24670 [marine bacterium AO1-C]|nr:hypothetical protein BKI52_24670 [marine bacterium AO1-C]